MAATQILSISPAANLTATAQLVRNLQDELNELFPERENLITQLIYGLLTREHVLVHGKFGTGKSRLVQFFFKAFADANFFSIELTKFMTESNIVGIPNPKIFREEGRIWHERSGTMLDAHFAELDELFDASDYLLRTLLGILNERRFNRGAQHERANLHMALASTNADPDAEVKRSPALGAVVDRFLFHTRVAYLKDDASRRRMYTNYLGDKHPSVQLPYQDVELLANTVNNTLIDDPILIELHNRIVQGFQAKRNVVFSDRRACQALKLAQANALLFGRTEVTPDDFAAVMWALCNGEDSAAQEDFKAVSQPLIEDVVKNRKPDVVRTQMQLLNELEGQLPSLPVAGGSGAPPTADELVTSRRTLVALEIKIKDVQPAHASIGDRQKKLLANIAQTKDKVQHLIDEEKPVK